MILQKIHSSKIYNLPWRIILARARLESRARACTGTATPYVLFEGAWREFVWMLSCPFIPSQGLFEFSGYHELPF